MQRVGLLLLAMASLVASGVIMDRGRLDLNTMGGLGLPTTQGIRGAGNVLTRDELLRQKFILDIVHQIYAPLQQQDLLMLDDRNIITNENLYMRPLTQEMQLVLDLINSNQMLSKQTVCSINNDQHVKQAVGFYRLLVNARDFETFKRLAVYGRQNINTEMFVHCLVLALGERQDTQMLIVPALHEIVPQLFVKDQLIDQIRHLDTGVASKRPQLMDIMGMGRRNFLLDQQQQQQQQQQGGLFDILNRSQLWMPWRELHKQMALRKVIGGNVVEQDQTQMDKLVITLPGNGLLSQDMSLKSYVSILIDELLLNQDTLRNTNINHIGGGRFENDDSNENVLFGKRGQINYGGITGDRAYNEYNTNSKYQGLYDSVHGRRFHDNGLGVTDELNHNIYGGVRQGMGMDMDMDINRNRYGIDEDFNMGHNTQYMGRNYNTQEGQRGINTVSANDARLLFIGKRRQNPNSVVNMGGNRYDEDYLISGGRRVAKDDSKYERQYAKHNYYNDERQESKYNDESQESKYNNYNDERINSKYNKYYNYNDDRQGASYYNDNDDDVTVDYIKKINNERLMNNDGDDYFLNSNQDINSYETNDYFKRNYGGRGVGIGMGNGRDDFLNMLTGGSIGQRQSFQNDQDYLYNRRESLDKHLPTTNINDERLLHINRHKLNDNIDINDLYNTGYQGVNMNKQQRSYLDQQNTGYQQYGRLGMYDNDSGNYRSEKHGRRNRRSIVNQEQDQYLGQTKTINGKLLLHSLQQLVARLNIERIALGQPQLIEGTQYNYGHGISSNKLVQLVGNSAINGVDVHAINQVERIIQQIDNALQQKIGQITVASYNQKVNEIGLMLAGQIKGLGLTDMLGDVLQLTNQQQRKGLIVNLLENEAAQILLAGIVQVVDQKVQQVFHKREEFISTLHGVNINNVEVDKLQTYLEQTNIDLTNLLSYNDIDQTIHGKNKQVLGLLPRLNHKAFNVKIDVTSDRQQQVVVRNLLVPKIDGQNNIIPLKERRQNVIVLDITTVELQQGRNSLKLNSNDITITSRNTTPLTKIYQLVMQALNGDIMLQENLLNGQTTLLPHHLLLPRGRSTGLPMQLITVITPMQGSAGLMGLHHQGNTLNTLLMDNLPLNYPLHCDITDLDKLISMPNLMVKDVKIYHDDNIQMPFMY